MSKTISLLWEASRPKTLPISLGPLLLANAICYKKSTMATPFDFSIALIAGLSFLLMQIGTNLTNDYYDGLRGVDHLDRVGPRRMTHLKLLPPSTLKYAFIICYLLAFLLGILLMERGGAVIALIGISSLLTAYLYTGGPFPLAYFGLGEVLAFLFFGPISFIGIFYLQHFSYDMEVIFWSIPIGLLVATPMAINNIRDYFTDQKSRKKTLAILFGQKFGRALPLILIFLAVLFPLYAFIFFRHNIFFILAVLLIAQLKKFIPLILKEPQGPRFNLFLVAMGKFILQFCFLNALGILFAY